MTHRVIPGRVHDLHRALAVLDAEGLQRRVRALARSGITEYQIACLLQLHIDTVRRVLSTTECPSA